MAGKTVAGWATDAGREFGHFSAQRKTETILRMLRGESLDSLAREVGVTAGWYLTSAPIITADWEASSRNKWTVPVGAGVGKLFKLGKLPINTSLQAYYNAVTPSQGPDWQLRFQVQFLLPTLQKKPMF